MLARTWTIIILGASLLASPAMAATKKAAKGAGSVAAPRPPAAAKVKPGVKAPAKPAAKVTPRPATPRPRATPTPFAESGDALVEAMGVTPALQGEEQLPNSVNWTRRVAMAWGIGIAPERGTREVRQTLARQLALEDGLHQLSLVVEKVRVNGDALVGDLTVADERLADEVNRRLRAAKISDTHVLPDGSVEIKVQLPLFGKDGLAGALLRDELSPIVFAADASGSLPTSQWTGVTIDAREAGAQPALAPSIRSTEGQGLADRSSVAYAHTLEGAGDLAGDHPLQLVAKRCAGTTRADLLLAPADMTKLKDALNRGGLSVVVVL